MRKRPGQVHPLLDLIKTKKTFNLNLNIKEAENSKRGSNTKTVPLCSRSVPISKYWGGVNDIDLVRHE